MNLLKKRQIEGILLDEYSDKGINHHLDFERVAARIVREVIEPNERVDSSDGSWWREPFVKR